MLLLTISHIKMGSRHFLSSALYTVHVFLFINGESILYLKRKTLMCCVMILIKYRLNK